MGLLVFALALVLIWVLLAALVGEFEEGIPVRFGTSSP
jgi:hypothetical protein